MKMTKWHILRILLCGFISVAFIWITTIVTMISIYTVYDWLLFSIKEGFDGMGSNVNIMIIASVIYHYLVAFFVIISMWKWFGLPERVLPEFKRKIE